MSYGGVRHNQPTMEEPVAARGGRDATFLAAGSLGSGVLAYVFFAAVTRALGAEVSAPVAVLWAWWSFAGAALTFPLQHWIARQAAIDTGEAGVRHALPRVLAAVTGISVLAGLLGWLARERLFGLDGWAFPLLVVAVGLGSAGIGVVRGTLSARRRFTAVGAGLVAENALRCVLAAGLALAGVDAPAAYGLALVAGYAAVLWPSALLPRATGAAGEPAALGFVTGASAGQLLAQAALTGGPVLLAAAGGAPAEVTALFAGLALFRAPYTLAIGLVSALTGRLTRLVVSGRREALARVRRTVVLLTAALALAGGLGGGWLGPGLMELVFGEGVRLAASDTAVVAVGSVLALANLVLIVGALARGRPHAAAVVWLVSAPVGVAGYLLRGGDALDRTCAAFLAVEAAAWVGFLVLDTRSDRLLGRQEDRGPEGQVPPPEPA
jgi:O-antigen/teichoic acid export membrane protein